MSTGLRELGYQECLDLLSAGVIGRAALATPAGPHIVPVNYAVVGEHIVIRTSPYSALGRYAAGAKIAFETDHIEPSDRSGWSVVARGRAETVDEPDEAVRLRRLAAEPWAPGSRALFLRVEIEELTGRVVGGP